LLPGWENALRVSFFSLFRGSICGSESTLFTKGSDTSSAKPRTVALGTVKVSLEKFAKITHALMLGFRVAE
jgi:hypothetical protein